MGACCSCFDAITGGKHSSPSDEYETEMSSRNSASGVPPPELGISRKMSSPTIQIQGFKVSGTGLALATIPIEQGMLLFMLFDYFLMTSTSISSHLNFAHIYEHIVAMTF